MNMSVNYNRAKQEAQKVLQANYINTCQAGGEEGWIRS